MYVRDVVTSCFDGALEISVHPEAADAEDKNVADVEAMENRVALVAELKRFYSALLADNRMQPVGGLHYVTAYLATDMIDPTSEPSLYEQLANHTMEISTLKEADLCGSNSVRERIFVTTIHKAKGLEFDNVIVFDAVDGRMPNFYSRTNPQMLARGRTQVLRSPFACAPPSVCVAVHTIGMITEICRTTCSRHHSCGILQSSLKRISR